MAGLDDWGAAEAGRGGGEHGRRELELQLGEPHARRCRPAGPAVLRRDHRVDRRRRPQGDRGGGRGRGPARHRAVGALAPRGPPSTRSEIARSSPSPVMFVRRGTRPSALAPREDLTRFQWGGNRRSRAQRIGGLRRRDGRRRSRRAMFARCSFTDEQDLEHTSRRLRPSARVALRRAAPGQRAAAAHSSASRTARRPRSRS